MAGHLRLDLAQYREQAAFSQFSTDMDKTTQAQLVRGEHLVEILKQEQYKPLAVEKQIIIIFADMNGYLDDLPQAKIAEFETGLFRYMDEQAADTVQQLKDKKAIDEALEKKLHAAIKTFKDQFKSSL